MARATKHPRTSWREVLAKPDAPRPLDLHQMARQIRHFGSFILRTPALPYFGTSERCLLRTEHQAKVIGAKETFANECLRIGLQCSDPIVQEAIHVASPSLYSKLVVAHDASNPLSLDLIFPALRYITRMSSRSTPFGMFAGVAAGYVGAENILRHPQAEAIVPHVRIDMSVIDEAVTWVSQRASVRRTTKLRVNNTYCELNSANARYVEKSYHAGIVKYSLANIEPTPYVTQCMTQSDKTADELAKFLTRFDNEICYADALEFVLGLVDAQLLIPMIAPTITSPDALSDLIHFRDVATELPALREVRQAIREIDQDGFHDNILTDSLRSALSALPFKVKESRAIQVDAHFSNADFVLSEKSIQAISDAVFPYYAVSYRGRPASLERFKSEFVKRFGMKEVPLALALDGESGIRFDVDTPSSDSLRTVDHVLLKRLVQSLEGGGGEIVLTDDDIIAISRPVPDALPRTMSVLASLSGVEDALKIHFKYVVAPSGAQLLGRFAFASSAIEQLVRDMTEFEETLDSGRIFAEIMHVPAGRTGNVICRPTFRQYEIPYVSPPSMGSEHSFSLSDLLISVEHDRIVLRSASLGLEILPRLSCAHNFSGGNNLNVYQFLCSLQHQDGASFSFAWGRSFDVFDYLPRLIYRNCIFASARWRITRTFVEKLKFESKRGPEEAFEWLQNERKLRGLPRIVQVEESDRALMFDLESPLSVALLADFLDAERHFYLVEGLKPDQCAVHDSAGNGYVSEIVLPLRRECQYLDGIPLYERPFMAGEQLTNFEDIVKPGGDVVYLKIYGGEKSLDNFVTRDLRRVWRMLAADEPHLRMFYVRYYDSAHHLRIRFLLKNTGRLWSYIVPKLLDEITTSCEKYLLRSTTLDTYEREIARYGGRGRMEICETIFSLDTISALDVFELLDTVHKDTQRWRYAIFIAHFIVESAFVLVAEKLQIFNEMFVAFADRAGTPLNVLKANLATMHRTRREAVDTVLFDVPEATSLEFTLLGKNQETLPAYRNAVRSLKLSSNNVRDRSILASIVHMSMNRIFAVNANQEEAVIYYLLVRALESCMARRECEVCVK